MIVDLFAGPGGWDVAARALGLDVIGLELDPHACATRRAAGLPTLQLDVAATSPLDFAGATGLIASPPCPSFSRAGKQLGQRDLPHLLRAISGEHPPEWDPRPLMRDERSILTLEPLRWATQILPDWIALEQVPSALPLWQATGARLAQHGYHVWTGKLSAERYGVPQTRERAILIAHRHRPVAMPAPTHQRYVPPRSSNGHGSLFDAAPARVVHPEDVGLEPWVSMADALGWGMTERPYPVIASSRTTGGPDKEKVGGSGARKILYSERDAGRWTHERPATTIAGDPRLHPPGHKINAADIAAGRTHYEGRAGKNAIRLTLEQAAALQTFPPGYPWQGGKGAQFQQIGNAVPPTLARAILAGLTKETP